MQARGLPWKKAPDTVFQTPKAKKDWGGALVKIRLQTPELGRE
jgi:hypothetical protein